MHIFDASKRSRISDFEPVSWFQHLNSEAVPEAAQARSLLEGYFENYPQAHRAALRGKIRSTRDDQHLSGVFELVLHELILRAGLKVVAIEPALEHTTTSPDFLVESGGGRIFVEAVVSMGQSQREAAAQRRIDEAIGAIRRVKSKRVYISLRYEGAPHSSISQRELRKTVQDWLDPFESDLSFNVTSKREGPKLVLERSGLKMTVSILSARTPLAEPESALGSWMGEVTWNNPGGGIREALEDKAKKYGELNHPYVIAVNSIGMSQGEGSTFDALLGSPCVVIAQHPDGTTTDTESRASDGVFFGTASPRNVEVSAVTTFDGLSAWSLERVRSRTVHNPWATYPLVKCPIGLSDHYPDGDVFRPREGRSVADLLDISAA